jgi:PmbA protein
MDTTSLADDIVKKALLKGCDAAEVFIRTSKRLSVEAKDRRVEALQSSKDFGIALKVIKNRKLGFSFTTNFEEAGNIVNSAVEGAEWTALDDYVDVADLIIKPPSEVMILDKDIENIKEDEVIEKALFLERTALDFDARIKKIRKAEIALAKADTTVFNSKGVNFSYRSSYINAHITVLANDGHDSQMGWDIAASRRLKDINFSAVARGASGNAIDMLGARKISPARAPVILNPSVASDFLGIFSASLSAGAVQKKRSFLAGRIGKVIISPLLNMVDDGLMPWRLGTKPVDDEGVPASKKIIVSNGSLTGFIHNTYTAKKDGVTSTGNAVRGSFKNLPGVDVTNFYIEPNPPSLVIARDEVPKQSHSIGAVPEDEIASPSARNDRLVKSVSRGILVTEAMGVHTANPISGDFSIGISGLWIENGEVAYPVKEAVMSGNILDLLKRVEGIGDDLKFYGKIGSPSLLIGEMDISA